MPTKSKKAKKRDYTYDHKYNHATIEQRSERNRARALVLKKLSNHYGPAKAKAMLKGKDIDHKKAIKDGGKTTLSNLQAITVHKNRTKKPKNFKKRKLNL